MEKLRSDKLWLGVLIGTLIPAILFGILYSLSHYLAPDGRDYIVKLPTLLLISIFSNLFSLRYYLVKLKYDRTGRGILLVTFIFAILYFVLYLKMI